MSATSQPITVAMDPESLARLEASLARAAALARKFDHPSRAVAARLAEEFGGQPSMAASAKLAEALLTPSTQAALRIAQSLSAQMTERLAKSITAPMTEQLAVLSDSALALTRARIAEAVSPLPRIPAFPNVLPPVVRGGLEPALADVIAPRSLPDLTPAQRRRIIFNVKFLVVLLSLKAAMAGEPRYAIASAWLAVLALALERYWQRDLFDD